MQTFDKAAVSKSLVFLEPLSFRSKILTKMKTHKPFSVTTNPILGWQSHLICWLTYCLVLGFFFGGGGGRCQCLWETQYLRVNAGLALWTTDGQCQSTGLEPLCINKKRTFSKFLMLGCCSSHWSVFSSRSSNGWKTDDFKTMSEATLPGGRWEHPFPHSWFLPNSLYSKIRKSRQVSSLCFVQRVSEN